MMNADYGSKERHGFIYIVFVIALGIFCIAISCKGPETNTVNTVGGDVKPPVALIQPLPAYTDEARKARTEGIVRLQCVIRKDGTVDQMKVLKGLGYGLDESAINTIKTKWRFKPGTRNSVPVDVQATIEVYFRLY